MKKSLKYFGYTLIVLLFLIHTIWLQIDTESLKSFVNYKLSTLLQKTKIVTDSVNPTILGVSFKDVSINSEKNSILMMDEIDIHFIDFGIFLGKIPFNIKLYKGHIDGYISLIDTSITFEAENIDLTTYPYIQEKKLLQKSNIDFVGKINWETFIGDLNVILKQLEVSGKSTLFAGFSLPETTFFSDTSGKFIFDSKKIKTNIILRGDISGSIKGDVDMNFDQLLYSTTNLGVRLKFKKEYIDQIGLLKSLLSMYMTNEQNLGVKITGSFKSPQFKKIR